MKNINEISEEGIKNLLYVSKLNNFQFLIYRIKRYIVRVINKIKGE